VKFTDLRAWARGLVVIGSLPSSMSMILSPSWLELSISLHRSLINACLGQRSSCWLRCVPCCAYTVNTPLVAVQVYKQCRHANSGFSVPCTLPMPNVLILMDHSPFPQCDGQPCLLTTLPPHHTCVQICH